MSACGGRRGIPAYRWVFTTATVLLAVHAGAGALAYVDGTDVFESGSGLAAIVTALLCYTAVNTCLVVGAIVLSAPERTFREVLGRGDEVVLELATLSMGALAAGAMSSTSPLHALLVLPPLVVLHRAVLVRHFQEVASIDGKTGLLNAAAWQDRADRVLQRAQRGQGSAAVLILDLDHFKLVNDRHGHLAGDRVLSSVAEASARRGARQRPRRPVRRRGVRGHAPRARGQPGTTGRSWRRSPTGSGAVSTPSASRSPPRTVR